jgi:hypothetical protein
MNSSMPSGEAIRKYNTVSKGRRGSEDAGAQRETRNGLARFLGQGHREECVMPEQSVHGSKRARFGVGGWLAIVILGGLLGAAIWYAFYGWNLTDAVIDTPGIIALILGVVFSTALGGGLMALVFWSNRKGYDR